MGPYYLKKKVPADREKNYRGGGGRRGRSLNKDIVLPFSGCDHVALLSSEGPGFGRRLRELQYQLVYVSMASGRREDGAAQPTDGAHRLTGC